MRGGIGLPSIRRWRQVFLAIPSGDLAKFFSVVLNASSDWSAPLSRAACRNFSTWDFFFAMAKDTIRISKCDAAKRQLRTAITIWFSNGDPVAVHTLAFAAYEVLHAICLKRDPNRNPVLLFDCPLIEEERRREWNQLMRKEANFFKHADRDGDSVIEFKPEVSLFFIFFAIVARDDCGEPDSEEESAFIVWLRINRPKMFSEEGRKYFKHRSKGHNVAQLRALTKSQFFRLWRTTPTREILSPAL
jgi:hypothetical protein